MVDRQPYTFDRVIRILFGVVSVVGLFYLVYILRGALLPFLVAWIVAYMLNPLVVYNKRVFKLKGRVVAITLAFLEVLITISLLCVLFLPSIIDEIAHMRELLSEDVYNSSSIPFRAVGIIESGTMALDYRGEFFRGLGLHHRFGGRNHQYRELAGRAVVYSFYIARL